MLSLPKLPAVYFLLRKYKFQLCSIILKKIFAQTYEEAVFAFFLHGLTQVEWLLPDSVYVIVARSVYGALAMSPDRGHREDVFRC